MVQSLKDDLPSLAAFYTCRIHLVTLNAIFESCSFGSDRMSPGPSKTKGHEIVLDLSEA